MTAGPWPESSFPPENILNAIADPIFVKDRRHVWVILNDACCRFIGRSRKDLIGRSDYNVFPKEQADVFWKKDEEVFRTGTENENEEQFTDTAGAVHTISTKKTLYRTPDGQEFIVGVIRDNTDKVRAERELSDSRAFLDSIIENIPNMIFVKEPKELRFVRFNRAGEELLGISRAQMYGKNDYDFFPRSEADFFTAKDREVLSGKRPVDIPEEPIHTHGHGDRLLHTRKVPVLDENGQPLYLLGISEDITARKRAEEALHESGRRFQSLVANVPGAVYRCANDKNWTMEYLSAAVEEIAQYPPSDFVGNRVRSFASIIHPQDTAAVDAEVQRAIAGRRPYTLEYRVLRRDGAVRWVYERGQAIYGDRGEVLWLDGVIFDVTDQKRAAEALLQTEATEARARFLSVVSHELRTPLQSIREGISVVLDGVLGKIGAEQHESLSIARRNVDRFARLINGVLDIQRLDVHDLPFAPEPYPADEVIAEAVKTMEPLARKKNLRLESKLAAGSSRLVYDRDRITQVLLNLLSNAIKFTDSGSVTVTSGTAGSDIRITVTDTGIGIRTEDMDKVFNAFVQLRASIDRSTNTGLGLTITKKIVEQYGGRIEARSRLGEGSVFEVRLPLRPAARTDA